MATTRVRVPTQIGTTTTVTGTAIPVGHKGVKTTKTGTATTGTTATAVTTVAVATTNELIINSSPGGRAVLKTALFPLHSGWEITSFREYLLSRSGS